jgi:hypothetical protein
MFNFSLKNLIPNHQPNTAAKTEPKFKVTENAQAIKIIPSADPFISKISPDTPAMEPLIYKKSDGWSVSKNKTDYTLTNHKTQASLTLNSKTGVLTNSTSGDKLTDQLDQGASNTRP